jgi:hypothetical protein
MSRVRRSPFLDHARIQLHTCLLALMRAAEIPEQRAERNSFQIWIANKELVPFCRSSSSVILKLQASVKDRSSARRVPRRAWLFQSLSKEYVCHRDTPLTECIVWFSNGAGVRPVGQAPTRDGSRDSVEEEVTSLGEAL